MTDRPPVTLMISMALLLSACAPRVEAPIDRRASPLAADPHDVWTQHNDSARTGATLVEATLTTSNVNTTTFGRLFTRAVDDQTYAQPLYLAGVPIAGGIHNVVYVATMADTVFAFDADDPGASAPLARRNLLDVAGAGARLPTNLEVGQACDQPFQNFAGNIGIVGTPVVDVAANTMYLLARSVVGAGTFVQRLHALDIATLADKVPPVVIAADVAGDGDGSVGGRIAFNPTTSNQRTGLLLHNGAVYLAWASFCDTDPFHGWVMGYDAATLRQVFVWNDTPDGSQGGIWQSGEGLTSDGAGIYVITGNGTSNVQTGGRSYGSTIVKLDPANPAAPVADWFMPHDAEELNRSDNDLGTSGLVLVPGTNLLVGGSKLGALYVVDRTRLGHFRPDADLQIVQSIIEAGVGHIHGSPITWTSRATGTAIYIWAEYDHLKQFPLVGGRLDEAGVKRSEAMVPDGMPGAILSISANGNTPGTGIVWASHPSLGDAENATTPGILRALDAEDVSRELWNSLLVPGDNSGNFAKFVPPTIANGKVYLATFSNQLVVYGLRGGGPAAPDAGGAPADATFVTAADAAYVAAADAAQVAAPDAAQVAAPDAAARTEPGANPTVPPAPREPEADAAPGGPAPPVQSSGGGGCSYQPIAAPDAAAILWVVPALVLVGRLRRRRR
jgi:hypothetical protein